MGSVRFRGVIVATPRPGREVNYCEGMHMSQLRDGTVSFFRAPCQTERGLNLSTITGFTYLLNSIQAIKFTRCFAAGPNRQGSNCSTRGACAANEAGSRFTI